MSKDKFVQIDLLNGGKCSILNITPLVLWRASYKHSQLKNPEFDITPFVLEEILLFDGKKRNTEFIGNLLIDDYIKIMEVVEVIMKKVSIK